MRVMTDLELLESYDENAEYPPPKAVLAAIERLASDGEELAITHLQRLIDFTRVQLFGRDEWDYPNLSDAQEGHAAPTLNNRNLRNLYKKLHESIDALIAVISRYESPAIKVDTREAMDLGQFQELPPGGALINLSDFTWDCRDSATSRVLPVWVSTCPGSFFSVDLRAEAHLKRFARYNYWNLFLRFESTDSRPPTIPDVILTDRFDLVNGDLTVSVEANDFSWLLSLREAI